MTDDSDINDDGGIGVGIPAPYIPESKWGRDWLKAAMKREAEKREERYKESKG